MEIINNEERPVDRSPRQYGTNASGIYIGSVLIAAGIAWMLYNFDVIDSTMVRFLFSLRMLIVVFGGFLLSTRKILAGVLITLTGICMILLSYFNIKIPIGDILLPSIIIAAGVAVMFRPKPRS